jgi:phospho-N-acetylmuramoyl-pentapeptide-transferase
VGALLAYLLFNTFPASVFMGDTGSLALGGFAAAITAFTGNVFYLAIVGFCFVISVISVLIQVIYYKVTHGKRVFLMAPIHHHFQEKGYSEARISYAYFVVTLFIGLVCIITAL